MYIAAGGAGVLHLPVVRLFSSCNGRLGLDVIKAGPGFSLPANIGDLDPAITDLNLSNCNLIGNILII